MHNRRRRVSMDKGASSMKRIAPIAANSKPEAGPSLSRPRVDATVASTAHGGGVETGDHQEVLTQIAAVRTELEELSARQKAQFEAMTDGFEALKGVLEKLVKASGAGG